MVPTFWIYESSEIRNIGFHWKLVRSDSRTRTYVFCSFWWCRRSAKTLSSSQTTVIGSISFETSTVTAQEVNERRGCRRKQIYATQKGFGDVFEPSEHKFVATEHQSVSIWPFSLQFPWWNSAALIEETVLAQIDFLERSLENKKPNRANSVCSRSLRNCPFQPRFMFCPEP